MLDLTFGEQVKIILSRKGMTIKELAETIEAHTGKKMSRQNLTQRLGRDNFQEQDMRMIAEILGCPFHLNILDDGCLLYTSPKIQKHTLSGVILVILYNHPFDVYTAQDDGRQLFLQFFERTV